MSSIVPPIPPNIASKTGPRIVGYLLHWALFGVLCTQVYMYHLAFPTDPRSNKFFVYSIFLLEILQSVIITTSAFHVFGEGYGNFAFFNDINLAWFSVPILSGIIGFLAEIFYAQRISKLSYSHVVPMLIYFLALVQLSGAIASAVVLKEAVVFSHLLGQRYSVTSVIWNGGSALCDIIIAYFMTYFLLTSSSEGMKKTRIFVKKMIRLVIETGTATAAIATLNLILVLLPNEPSYYLVTSEILAKVYSNSMMVMLNSRMQIGDDMETLRGNGEFQNAIDTEIVFRRSIACQSQAECPRSGVYNMT